LAISLGLLDAKLAPDDAAKPIARDARDAVASALDDLRRFSQGIYPSVLTERGLKAAIEELCERTTVRVHVHLALPSRLPPQVEGVAYFLISEALANVAKHSHASEARITASHHAQRVSIAIADNGIGGATPTSATSGLQNITERVEAVGGGLIISSPQGAGTTIHAELPGS
jgi:signal transduction histidine kinase